MKTGKVIYFFEKVNVVYTLNGTSLLTKLNVSVHNDN